MTKTYLGTDGHLAKISNAAAQAFIDNVPFEFPEPSAVALAASGLFGVSLIPNAIRGNHPFAAEEVACRRCLLPAVEFFEKGHHLYRTGLFASKRVSQSNRCD